MTIGNPYKRIYIGGKLKKEHRLLMEIKLGRKLNLNEVVHHKNGDKKDNRLRNLEVMDKKKHSKLHINNKLFKLEKFVRKGFWLSENNKKDIELEAKKYKTESALVRHIINSWFSK